MRESEQVAQRLRIRQTGAESDCERGSGIRYDRVHDSAPLAV